MQAVFGDTPRNSFFDLTVYTLVGKDRLVLGVYLHLLGRAGVGAVAQNVLDVIKVIEEQ
jgi:hypothetical protein